MKPLPGKPASPTDYIVKRRAEILRATPGFCGSELTLIDLGCGNGATMLELASDFCRCDGIDRSLGHAYTFYKEAEARGITNCFYSARLRGNRVVGGDSDREMTRHKVVIGDCRRMERERGRDMT